MHLLATALTAFLFCTFDGYAGGAPPARTVVTESTEDSTRSIEDLWVGSTAVVRARILTTETKSKHREGARYPSVRTDLRLQVMEVLKGSPTLDKNGQMVASQRAGTVELPDMTLVVSDAEVLKVGAEYVIFLGWNRYTAQWVLRDSLSGAFNVGEGTVGANEKSKLGRKHRGRPTADFLSELRRLPKDGQ